MPLRRLSRGAAEAWEVPRDLLLGRYPAFVTGGALVSGEIPVFVFHGAEPHSFGRKMQFLADNGYETLAIDEYVAVLRGERRAPPKAVLLTFDDGRGSVWSVAAPILKRHGMKGVVFLVPGRMRARPALGPALSPTGSSDAPAGPEVLRETGEQALMSWDEIEALARGSTFEFHSHTLSHARIHTGPTLAGFATPHSRQGYDAFDQPLIRAKGRDLLGDEVPLGTPLFRSAPRTSEAARFFEDETLRRACIDAVAEGGAEGFFQRADWETRLRRLLRKKTGGTRLETPEERAQAIAFELAESKRLIEQRTGRPVLHLCYPWHTAGPTARKLADELGYRTAFCGKVEGTPTTLPGGDLRQIARLGEDYLELLPGAGRATLFEILREKWNRRFGPTLG